MSSRRKLLRISRAHVTSGMRFKSSSLQNKNSMVPAFEMGRSVWRLLRFSFTLYQGGSK